jgi:hypothetical protein
MTAIPKRRERLPRALDLAVLALSLSVLVCSLLAVPRLRPQHCEQGCWVELRESAVKNKEKLARLLLTDSTSVANTTNGRL